MNCWICGARGERQLKLRTRGALDGRRLCLVCARRLLSFVGSEPAEDRLQRLAPVWPQAAVDPGGEPDRVSVRRVFTASAVQALECEPPVERLSVALVLLDCGLWAEVGEVLAPLPPELCESGDVPEALLTSVVARLLEPEGLAVGGREALAAVLYPQG